MIIATFLFSTSALALLPALPAAESEFDFWVGKWKCAGEVYAPDGKTTHTEGTNNVMKIMAGKVVQENFSMPKMKGMSVSAYDPAGKRWRQTWVDDQGGYIPLSGTFSDGKMTLEVASRTEHPTKSNRMVYSNITADSFDWDWQSTTDAGATWKIQWHLRYTRAK